LAFVASVQVAGSMADVRGEVDAQTAALRQTLQGVSKSVEMRQGSSKGKASPSKASSSSSSSSSGERVAKKARSGEDRFASHLTGGRS
jgi:hypothetical protein